MVFEYCVNYYVTDRDFFPFLRQIFVLSWLISCLILESRKKTLKRSRKVSMTIRIAFGHAVSLSLDILVLQSSHEYDPLSFPFFFFPFIFLIFFFIRPVKWSNSVILALNIDLQIHLSASVKPKLKKLEGKMSRKYCEN